MEKERTYNTKNNNPFSVPEEFKQATSPFAIDGYDSTILEDRAYLDINDEMLKLEYRIKKVEQNLSIIEDEISSAKNIDDLERLEFLEAKKRLLVAELKELNSNYFNIGPMSKFTTILSKIFKRKPKNGKTLREKFSHFISKYILSAISKRLSFTFGLRDSMSKLSDINRSVDELISLRIPFGGITGRYEKLTNYINKANDIHARISKNVNEFEEKTSEIVPKVSGMGGLLDVKQ